ncbi:hypothetical protein BH11BAC1_BH11BAC1_11870 [soil metagenome]
MPEMKRVLLISNVPQPYRIPLFNEIGRQLKENNLEFKVVFAADGYKRRKANIDFSEMKFQYEILNSLKMSFGNVEKTMFTYGGLNSVISKFNPDKIIVVGFSLATLKIYLRSFFRKTSYIIWSGALEFPGRFDSVLRKFERRMLIKRAAAFISYGSKAKEYLVNMGAPAEKIFIGMNTVDTKYFEEETDRIRSQITREDKKHLLYVGYLVPRKNVSKLIPIIEALSKTRNDFVLDILGDGSDRALLEKLVEEKRLQDVIKLHGFIQKQDLPKYFAQSSCFLFQTDFDVWGLVLNEAMAAGIPVLSSINAGATFDLIVDGETGFAVDYNKGEMVLGKINLLLDNDVLAEKIGLNARKFVEEKAAIHLSAKSFIDCLSLS